MYRVRLPTPQNVGTKGPVPFWFKLVCAVEVTTKAVYLAMPGKRPRHDGPASELLPILRHHITTAGCVQYGEDFRVDPMDKEALKTHAALLRALREKQPNLSFAQVPLQKQLGILAAERAWPDQSTFAVVVAKRVRLMCRHAHQALAKRSVPKWAKVGRALKGV